MTNTTYETIKYKIIEDDLVLLEDTTFMESLIVKGNITCKNGKHSLYVYGNIIAENIGVNNFHVWNIDARNIDARNIWARNVNANNIDAKHIEANDINANVIICEERTKTTPTSKTNVLSLAENRSELEKREIIPRIEPPTFKFIGYDLFLFADTIFEDDLVINGNIICKNGRHSLTVHGNIYADNITVKYIHAKNINANCIYTYGIEAWKMDINNITCNKLTD